MIALLLAAQVAAAAPSVVTQHLLGPPQAFYNRQGRLAAAFCKGNGKLETSDPALLYRQDGKPLRHKLAELPKANKEIAVNRMIEGCAAPLVVQFNVGP